MAGTRSQRPNLRKSLENEREDKRKELLEIMKNKLINQGQVSRGSHANIIKELTKLYYEEAGSINLVVEHHKIYANLLWSLVPSITKSKSVPKKDVERILELFITLINQLGTPNNMTDNNFMIGVNNLDRIKPLFLKILKSIKRNINDVQLNSRISNLKILQGILKVHNSYLKEEAQAELRRFFIDLLIRFIVDKSITCRIETINCCAYFLDVPEIESALLIVIESAKADKLRCAALSVLRKTDNLEIDVFINKAYDTCFNTRTEAFVALKDIELDYYSEEDKINLISCLCFTIKDKRTSVNSSLLESIKALIERWMASCENSPIEFLEKFESVKFCMCQDVLDVIFNNSWEPSKFHKYGGASFLNTEKFIPLEELSIERSFYWLYLCKHFVEADGVYERLFPESISISEYIEKVITRIREEYFRAQVQWESCDEAEQNLTLEYCLGNLINIMRYMRIEEGARAGMVELMFRILQEKTLYNPVAIIPCVDFLYELEGEQIIERISGYLKQVLFDPFINPETGIEEQTISKLYELSNPELEAMIKAIQILSNLYVIRNRLIDVDSHLADSLIDVFIKIEPNRNTEDKGAILADLYSAVGDYIKMLLTSRTSRLVKEQLKNILVRNEILIFEEELPPTPTAPPPP